jgi:hypothetical protein
MPCIIEVITHIIYIGFFLDLYTFASTSIVVLLTATLVPPLDQAL